MTCECQWWWMWSSPAPPRHLRAVKNNASVCCSHQQSALTLLPQTSSLCLFFLAIYIYWLVIVCCLLNPEIQYLCLMMDEVPSVCFVNVCMQFKSMFDSYWVKWAICSTFRIELELKSQNTRDCCQNKSVISSYFSYKLMFGWHVIKALTVGVCFETEVIDSFLQGTVRCFSSGFLIKFSWPISLISLTKEWWRGEGGEGERERRRWRRERP